MCGIVGLFSSEGRLGTDQSLLTRMNSLLTHRGPDDKGSFQDRYAGIAMCRLKVIDLEGGHQPIHDGEEKYWIVFNGEIYNYAELRAALEKKGHRFYSHSDTEVILHQFLEDGENCVHALKGMFAFAIYNPRDASLFLARDRLGVKPLFYHTGNKGFAFASEIKPLLEVPWLPRELNLQAVSHFLSLNYLPAPWTPFQGIHQLPPGHWMKVRAGKTELQQYWDVPLGEEIDESEEAALKKIDELLHRSMERRLIADVPIGAFLSGGLDSSTLVYLMKEHRHEKIKTFSVGFDHPSYDETPYARQVAEHFGTDHYEIRCKPEDAVNSLRDIAWHADGLLADQAALPLYMVSKLAKEHVTVCLSGDGGDEVFVGYPTFQADHYHRAYSRVPRFLRKGIIEPALGLLPASTGKLSFEYRAKKFAEAGDFSAEKAHYWWRTIFTDAEKRDLLLPQAARGLNLDSYSLYGEFLEKKPQAEFTNRCLYADLKVWLAGNNLYKVDTMTMAHGLEARVPFLDHELVEYMARLPAGLKFKNRVQKYLFKKYLAGKLPESIVSRKKSGWHTPIAAWFQGSLAPNIAGLFSEPDSLWGNVFDKDYVARLVREHQNGSRNHTFKIWGLLILDAWDKSFRKKLSCSV